MVRIPIDVIKRVECLKQAPTDEKSADLVINAKGN